MEKILIVDDAKVNLGILEQLLKDRYKVFTAESGTEALEIIDNHKIDLVLLDMMMPEMDGIDVINFLKMKHSTKYIPVIFITANTDEESISKAYEAGGVDYIIKPFRKMEVDSKVANHLTLAKQNSILKQKIKEKTLELRELNKELALTQKEIVFTMGMIGEKRSKETGNHVKRVASYSEILAKAYGLSKKEIKLLKQASPMHDIGKVAIPDSILNKPSPLNDEEFEIMKKHTIYGYEMLKFSERELLKAASIVAYEHHEKWDGTGYPRGLKGEEIHIFARITAVADVFDALGSDRIYKKAWEDEKIFQFFESQRGKHFEPKLIDLFFENLADILKVREKLKDVFD